MTFAEVYDKLNEDIDYEDILTPIVKRLDKDQRILDVGCGSGHSMKTLKEKGFKYLSGLDNSQEMLLIAKTRMPNIPFYLHDIQKPFFKVYDAVIAVFDVLNYFKEPKQVLINICQLLKPNGIFIFDIYKEEYLEVMDGYHETEVEPFDYFWKVTVDKNQLNHQIGVEDQVFEIKQYIYPLQLYIEILEDIGFSVSTFNGNDERKYYIEAKKLL